MKSLYGRAVFAVDGEPFFWEDVVLDATRDGRWARWEREVGAGVAALAAGAAQLPEEVVDEAAQEFRYERDLITAREMEEWLEARGLTPSEWMGHVRRHVARMRNGASTSLPGALAPADALRVELLCSPQGVEFAMQLAERAAAAAAAPSGEPVALPPLPQLRDEIAPPNLAERWERLAAVTDGVDRFRRQILTAEALKREVSHHHLDWIRIDCRALGFGDEGRAREAALCVREDGLGLDEVSLDAHVPAFDSRFYLDELEADLRPAFLAAQPVDVIGPVPFDGGYSLFRIMDKVMPSEQDPEIRRRAEASVITRSLAEEVQRRIRWRTAL
ncbi:MAG TPA: hypothetical protein VJN95_00020 [Gemmatimonadales bacterium]|nr:hypothetical protein [Gemmatimonadales bacterium]